MVVFEDVLYMYGGYSKYKDDEDAEVEHGVVHDDMWALDLKTHKVGVNTLSNTTAKYCEIP